MIPELAEYIRYSLDTRVGAFLYSLPQFRNQRLRSGLVRCQAERQRAGVGESPALARWPNGPGSCQPKPHSGCRLGRLGRRYKDPGRRDQKISAPGNEADIAVSALVCELGWHRGYTKPVPSWVGFFYFNWKFEGIHTNAEELCRIVGAIGKRPKTDN